MEQTDSTTSKTYNFFNFQGNVAVNFSFLPIISMNVNQRRMLDFQIVFQLLHHKINDLR
jgi:hypothetical protein